MAERLTSFETGVQNMSVRTMSSGAQVAYTYDEEMFIVFYFYGIPWIFSITPERAGHWSQTSARHHGILLKQALDEETGIYPDAKLIFTENIKTYVVMIDDWIRGKEEFEALMPYIKLTHAFLTERYTLKHNRLTASRADSRNAHFQGLAKIAAQREALHLFVNLASKVEGKWTSLKLSA